jgi:hypothetical protein|tara:strand:- start:6933 stop:7166 length:234 start_codon:yes stop_codon:yes gene_type:complete
MNFGYKNSFLLIDKGNIEVFGPLGLAYYIKNFSKIASSQQTGFLSHYTFLFVVALFGVLLFGTCLFIDSSSNLLIGL